MEQIIVRELHVIIALLVILCILQLDPIRKKLWKTAKEFAFRVACLIPFYLSWLLPRDKKLVLFASDFGFSGNPKYLFLEAQKHPEIHAVWITKTPSVYKQISKLGYEVYMCKSKKGFRMQLKAGTLIHSHSIREDFNYIAVAGATSINTWHGVGLKRSWYRSKNSFAGNWKMQPPSLKRSYHLLWARANMARKNYVIATSEDVADYYPATYNVKADHVINLGQARNDVFYDDSLEEGKLPECFRRGKTIVYMPTHREYGERRGNVETVGEDIDYDRLSKVLEKYGYTFVVKQHKFNTNLARYRKYPNIVDISAQNMQLDTQLLLKHTDILITDYSSCYTDYLLLDRPVVFYCYDLAEYLTNWDLNFDYDYVTPGPKCFDTNQLIKELENLMQGKDEFGEERQRVKRVFYSPENQGPVAEKQIDYIIDNIIKPKGKKE